MPKIPCNACDGLGFTDSELIAAQTRGQQAALEEATASATRWEQIAEAWKRLALAEGEMRHANVAPRDVLRCERAARELVDAYNALGLDPATGERLEKGEQQEAVTSSECCGEQDPRAWYCTKRKGHDGDHEARSIGGQTHARWPQELERPERA